MSCETETNSHTEKRLAGVGGQEQTENLGCADAKYYIYIINNEVLVQHRELYSVSCDKSYWKRILKRTGIYVY